MDDILRIVDEYAYLRKNVPELSREPLAAAVLILASRVTPIGGEEFGHELCLAIRNGLFGNGVPSDTSVLHGLSKDS